MTLPRRCYLASLILLAGWLTGPAYGQKVTKDIAYTTDAAGTQMADFYQPAGSGPFPAVIYIHGGSWRSGSKRSFHRLAADLAAKGYVGFAMNYDLHPHSWPLSLQESTAAVAFVRAHAAEYRVDPNQLIVLGTSAGGELAALVALSDAAKIRAAIILNGVFDLHSNAHVVTRYLGGKCEEVRRACEAASPQAQIRRNAPPFFIGHGTDDHVVPYMEAQAFAAALKQSGTAVTVYDARGGPHMYWEKSSFYSANLQGIETFLSASKLSSAP